jgi:hypothetical protein
MVVRRSRGSIIRLIHSDSREVIVLQVLELNGRTKQARIKLTFDETQFFVNIGNESVLEESDSFSIRHRNGDVIKVEMASVKYWDTNIRLIDKTRLFEFDWTDRCRMQGCNNDNF